MNHAEKCPVCKGKGKVKSKSITTNSDGERTKEKIKITCHGCNGTGWVTVQDNNESIKEYIPYYPINYPTSPEYPYTPWTYPIITCGDSSNRLPNIILDDKWWK